MFPGRGGDAHALPALLQGQQRSQWRSGGWFEQDFRPTAPNRCWAGDITDIRTTAGWRYLAVWIDLFSRRVVGWSLAQRMDPVLVIESLNQALGDALAAVPRRSQC
ncbi:MAG: DDE-type integrase/transposase/recombinase [Cyanobium sp. M30B3]|nr:MAG: DDE-type integrase/transposase/recombinase [Cyanobium sp. M30B3]